MAANHPSWFLRDRTGHIIEWSDWRGLYPMDVADPGYQQTWSDNVLAELRAHRWDGVMMDDVLTILSHSTVDKRVSTRIPDNAAQYAATTSFLSHVAPQIRRAGYLAVPNLSVEWNNWQTTLADWTRYVSGWENEHFTNWPGSSERFVGADWQWKFDLARWLAARDVPLLAVSYGSAGDLVGQTYHRATWLLSWNGRTGASIYVPDEVASSHWLPAATQSIGRPLAPAVQHPDGTWTRRFSRGIVAVNPTAASRPVDLAGTSLRRDRGCAPSGSPPPPPSSSTTGSPTTTVARSLPLRAVAGHDRPVQIFHIATAADWVAAQQSGSYTTSTRGVTLAEEGFIHASRADQWEGVRAAYYADVDEPLVLLEIDTALLDVPVVEEIPAPGVAETFPHVYGAIPPTAVVAVTPL